LYEIETPLLPYAAGAESRAALFENFLERVELTDVDLRRDALRYSFNQIFSMLPP